MVTSRNWIDHEEDVLLTILEEMVADGVRCETGSFKAGTFYSSAYEMMNTSGFGYDNEKKCVVMDSDKILQEWVKKHPNASCKPNKPFPLYPRLCTVFKRDQATGIRILRLPRCLHLHLPHLILLLHIVHLNLLGRGKGVGIMVMQILYLLSVKVGIKLLLK
ncbi:hypothetical protein D8674_016685 [Pyrus ussuriensis x Pyrus communis]|uniref:Myb/SANT-like domain-containing protein n=1 Tax=Pyrus ussuriensis x Pyrus communis TaxID=2448454 RepID=A0A5N5HAX3_9ROSA|nr:hypothetical protein D8674_016685 [Pyrus ussuriensis x Pyrus communis]